MNPDKDPYGLKKTPDIKKYSGMRKQDNIEPLSSSSKAPPICVMTTRMMQTPLVKSTKSIRLLGAFFILLISCLHGLYRFKKEFV